MKEQVKSEVIFKTGSINVRVLATDSNIKLEISEDKSAPSDKAPTATVQEPAQVGPSIFELAEQSLADDPTKGYGKDFDDVNGYLATIGLRLRSGKPSDQNTIRAIDEIMREYYACGKNPCKFLAPFKTILAAWPNQGPQRFQAAIVKDIAAFEMKHWGVYNDEELARHLAKEVTSDIPYTPLQFMEDIKVEGRCPGTATQIRYNLGRRKKGHTRLFMNS